MTWSPYCTVHTQQSNVGVCEKGDWLEGTRNYDGVLCCSLGQRQLLRVDDARVHSNLELFGWMIV